MDHKLETWFAASAGVASRRNIVLRRGAKSKAAVNFRALSGGFVLLLALSLQFSALRTVTDNQTDGVRDVADDVRHGRDQLVEAFAPDQPADPEDQPPAAGIVARQG